MVSCETEEVHVRVVARGVRFTYPRANTQVLAGVDFDIPANAVAAIVGTSGSGKTTLLSLMGGLLSMQQGTISSVDDDGVERPLSDTASWILQTVSLLPDRTAADNVAIGAYSDRATRIEAMHRARETLTAVGLADRAKEPARILSGGEAQHLAIARALASQRPVILADEPTGQLDASTSATVLDAMVGSHADRSVIIVTHDPDVAARCDIVLELRDGILHQRARA